jgi:hypothetical protein
MTIQFELNNLMEVNDLLKHKLHEETLSRRRAWSSDQ